MRNKQTFSATPKELGYRMPAEWEEHDAIWLSWPHDPTTFPGRVERAEEAYVQIIKLLHSGEDVNLFVKDKAMKAKAMTMLCNSNVCLSKVHFYEFNYADVWFRDYGPTFVTSCEGQLAMVRWIFNSWGEKYEDLLKDCEIPEVINSKMRLRCFEPGIVLEGGSIDVNGIGTVLTTEQCLLNKNRNPQLSKGEIEDHLRSYLNVQKIIWLRNGIVGDDTDGHVDDLARFVGPKTIVCACEENKEDENYDVLRENYDILKSSTDQDNKALHVVKLPMPGYIGSKSMRLPASYANFYIGNQVVLVPVFGHKNDQVALGILQKLFPTRRVAAVNCADLVYGLGTIHCMTQQQPRAKSAHCRN